MSDHPLVKEAKDRWFDANVVLVNAHRHGTITEIGEANRAVQIARVRTDLAQLEHVVLPRRQFNASQPNATALEADDLFDIEARIISLKHDIAFLEHRK